MAKLSEKQINIISLAGGVVVFILFGVFSYMDYDEVEVLKKQQAAVEQEINQAKTKKAALVSLKSDLYVLKENYDFVKQKLPDNKEILKFYETLDEFRLSKNIEPWKSFEVLDKGFFSPEEDEPGQKTDQKTAPKTPPQKQAPQMLTTTEYKASLPLTFNQLGEMLTAIESYPRYYGVTSIQLAGMSSKIPGAELSADVNLTLVSFTYPQVAGFDEKQVVRLLSDFKPTDKEQKKIQDLKSKWDPVNFQWTPLPRNPFDKSKVLTKENKKETDVKTNKMETVDVVDPAAVPQKILALEKNRNHLYPFAVAKLWVELQSKMAEANYEENLTKLVITGNVEASLRQKAEQMQKELREWKVEIKKVGIEQKARQFLETAAKKIQEMENIYLEGKELSSVDTFKKVITIYQDLLPQLKEYEPLENKITQLQVTRKRAEELYRKADTQIKIIQEVAKLELQGVIYWANKPQHSVAFISFSNNKKVVRKDDVVMAPFVVQDIKEGEVILRYNDETVSLRLKRVVQAMHLNKKSS